MSSAISVTLLISTVLACASWVRSRRRDAARARLEPAATRASRSRILSSRSSLQSLSGRVAIAALGVVAGAVTAGPVAAAIGLAVGVATPLVVARRAERRHRVRLDEQLADAVGAIGAGLRAGLSLTQAISHAADECEPPLADDLRVIVDRVAMGVPLGQAINEWAATDDLADTRLIDGVLTLHRRTGGDLPSVLDRLADTLRERRSAAQEVRSLTAQARMSGAILGFLPIGFFCFLVVTSREDVQAALSAPAGLTAVLVGFTLQGAAFLWIRSLLRVT